MNKANKQKVHKRQIVNMQPRYSLFYAIGLNVRSNSIKLLEGNMEENLSDFGLGNGFLAMTSKGQQAKEKNR